MASSDPLSSAEPEVNSGSRNDGLGRVLIAVYLVLALAATLRGVYQLLTKFDEAPLAYSLSLLSGVIYIFATVALIKRTGAWRVGAWLALSFELAGVLIVGTLSIIEPQLFDHPSVWSWFGAGYLWIPLFLPVIGMLWLRAEDRERARVAGEDHGAQRDLNESVY